VAVFVVGLTVTSAAAALAARAAMRVQPAGAMSSRGSETRNPQRRLARRWIAGTLGGGALAAVFVPSVRALAPAPYLATLALMLGGALLVADALQAAGNLGGTAAGRRFGIVRMALATFRALPHRLAIAVGALAVALSAVVGFAIASASFGAALERWAGETYRGDILVSALGNEGDGTASNSLQPALRDRARRIEGVTRVDGLRSESVRYRGSTLIVRGDDGFAEPATPRAGPSPRPQPALVSRALARSLQLHSSDVFTLPTPAGSVRLKVAGLQEVDASGNGAITVARRLIVERFHDGRLDALRVEVAPRVNLATLRSRLARLLVAEPVVVATTRELRDQALGLTRRSAAIVDALAAVCLVMSLLGTASAASGLIYERRRDIALLRYLGATRRTVRDVILIETFVWAAVAASAGLLMGLAVAAAQLAFVDALAVDSAVMESIPVAKLAAALAATLVAAMLGAVAVAAGATRIRTATAREAP
jgi:putative ABC transport system permease protein